MPSHLFSSFLLSYFVFISCYLVLSHHISASLSSLNPRSNLHIYLNNKLEVVENVMMVVLFNSTWLYTHILSISHLINLISSSKIMSANQTWKKTDIASDRIVFNLVQPPDSIAFTVTETSAISQPSNFSAICRGVGTFYVWYFRKKSIIAPLRVSLLKTLFHGCAYVNLTWVTGKSPWCN